MTQNSDMLTTYLLGQGGQLLVQRITYNLRGAVETVHDQRGCTMEHLLLLHLYELMEDAL